MNGVALLRVWLWVRGRVSSYTQAVPRPKPGSEPVRVYQDRTVWVARGPRTTDLIRPPSLKTKDRIPREAVLAARDAIEHGFTVTEGTQGRRTLRAIAAMLLFACAGGALVATLVSWAVLPRGVGSIVWLIGFLLLTFGARAALGPKWSSTRLSGRSIAKKGRHSAQLWEVALTQVDAGTRQDSELPAIHRAAIVIANAEDRVSRLANKNKYQLNQGEVDQARSDLGLKVAALRATLGLPALTDEPSYLSNRWAEIAGVFETPPTNPDDLR